MKSKPKKKYFDLTHFYHMSLAVGKRSSNGGEEDRWRWRQSKLVDDRDERRRWLISRPISLSSFDENQMVWLCVTFKFVCFEGIEGKKLANEVAREKGERKKENKKKKEEERELCGMFWSVEEMVGKKEERRKKRKE